LPKSRQQSKTDKSSRSTNAQIPHSKRPGQSLEPKLGSQKNGAKNFLELLGPGLITGASDDDPSGIGTYAQAGAALGYAPLWLAWVTFPMMWTIQYICAKIGMVSGTGLAQVLQKHYSRPLLYTVVAALTIANTINAGVDLGAIAAALNLLVPIPIVIMIIPITVSILVLQIWGSYRLIAKVFKWLTLALFAYILSAFFAHPVWRNVVRGTLVPTVHFDSQFLSTVVAVLGTTITPYLFFWQANNEVEEEISMGRRTLAQRRGATKAELKYANADVAVGMLFSNVVMYFIILATAATLHQAGKTEIQSATEAAEALRPLAGNAAYIMLAVGLIGAGFLCVPILTGSSAYAIAEALGWKRGLDEKPRRAKLFYGVIAISTFLGMLINFLRINPIRALFWTAVINGFLAPPVLVIVMLVANNRKVLGREVNGRVTNVMGWLTTVTMFVAAIALVLTWT
jgi:NRAMP (natural resistance-associated macrophage protein)-like metal ion transporter